MTEKLDKALFVVRPGYDAKASRRLYRLCTPFQRRLSHEELEELKECLARRADPQVYYRAHHPQYGAWWRARSGDAQAVGLLLRAGFFPDFLPSPCRATDSSMLYASLVTRNHDTVRLLLDHGADPDLPMPEDGDTVLLDIAARDQNYTAFIKMLLAHGADMTRTNKRGDTVEKAIQSNQRYSSYAREELTLLRDHRERWEPVWEKLSGLRPWRVGYFPFITTGDNTAHAPAETATAMATLGHFREIMDPANWESVAELAQLAEWLPLSLRRKPEAQMSRIVHAASPFKAWRDRVQDACRTEQRSVRD